MTNRTTPKEFSATTLFLASPIGRWTIRAIGIAAVGSVAYVLAYRALTIIGAA